MIAGILRRMGSRRLLVVLDQAASSLSNVVVTIMVARLVTTTEFGAFSVALVAYQLALTGIRALTGEPWLSVHSTDEGPAHARAAADLVAAAFVTSLLAGVVAGVAGAVAGGVSFEALVPLALALPVVGLQDALRYVAVVDRPQLALASDLAWLVVLVGLLAAAPAGATAAWFVAAWGVSGGVGLAVALATMRVPVTSGSARRWFRRHRMMAGAYFAEAASARGAGDVVLLGLGAVAGLRALGTVRAAQVFYGPLNTLFSGIYLVLVPDGARARDEPRKLVRLMAAATAVIVAAAGAWTAAGVLLPDRLGTELFGATWAAAQEVMLPMGLAVVAGSACTGGFAGLRSLGDAPLSLRARLWSLPPQSLLALGGAAIGAAMGYAVGHTIGTAVVAVIWWSSFAAALRRRQAKHLRRGRRRRPKPSADDRPAAHRSSETAA